jgi:hypothetical protein
VPPFLLRHIDKRRWDRVGEEIPWLPAGELPAAPLGDLKTTVDSVLSVWEIQEDRSNLEEVVAALAATRDTSDKYDYALFEMELLAVAGIRPESTRGNSADDTINDQWHRNLVELTSSKLVQLARSIYEHGSCERVPERRVNELICYAVEAGRIPRANLKENLRRGIFGA